MKTTAAIIVAGGTGSRMGGNVPKTYRILAGKPVLWHSIKAFYEHPEVVQVVVVHHADHTSYLTDIAAEFPQIKLTLGGATRQQSVCAGLEAITKANIVLIHDAARPKVSSALISRVIAAANPAAIPVLPVTDTIKHRGGMALSRSDLFAAQTPQGFDYATILKLHREATQEVTDDAALAEAAGIEVTFVEGEATNRKITTQEDWEQMSQRSEIRVGNGYDVHAFVPHEKDTDKNIKICGVAVECSMAIEGHSDGDVGLHALTDAILGAIGAGDIGQHFPSDDARWKGADSEVFLQEAMRLMRAAGGELGHADVTIIAQMPKVSPQREAMRARIAEICGVAVERVSVKATTTDHLGFIGRKEGLAAMATATVRS